jgi:hypothetical protein
VARVQALRVLRVLRRQRQRRRQLLRGPQARWHRLRLGPQGH